MDTWNRAELFREFIGMTTSIYDMTVRMDVTNLINSCKENGQSFFINYLYLALRELNAIPEFRMRVHNGEPYLYNRIDCSFTVANNYGYFVNRSMTCPLSSRHFLWTPVMQHKHNGLPSGFVLS
ncbi:MAG TPA: hypothetical protein H9665_03045 [Firmicutes bacterium]|nr:hypothetical protein [Bacillota bacterium]